MSVYYVYRQYFSVVIPDQTLVECAMKCRKTSTTYLLYNENEKHCLLIDDELMESLQTTVGYSRDEGDTKSKNEIFDIKSCVVLFPNKFGLITGSE